MDKSIFHFLLNPVGSAGDVHPYIGLAQQLKSRGHEVSLITNESFRSVAERYGISFYPVGVPVDWRQVSRDPKLRTTHSAWKESMGWAAINPMTETYHRIASLLKEGRTCVVSPVWSFGAKLACEKLRIPHVNLLMNSILLRSVHFSPVMPMMYLPRWMPKWMKSIEFAVADRYFIDPVLLPKLNEFRETLGLRPISRIMHRWWFSSDLVLGLFPNWFTPQQPDWPVEVQYVGHPLWDPEEHLDEQHAAIEFCSKGDPPILFVPGSVGPGGDAFFRSACLACERLGLRAIFLDRNDEFMPTELPASIKTFRYVPLKQIAKLSRAVVHSGNAGILNQALAAGVPHLVWPRVNDQFDNAMRLERLQVSITLRGRQIKPHSLRNALHQLVSNPSYKVNAMFFAAKLKESNPMLNLTDAVESFMQQVSDQALQTSFPLQ